MASSFTKKAKNTTVSFTKKKQIFNRQKRYDKQDDFLYPSQTFVSGEGQNNLILISLNTNAKTFLSFPSLS